MQAGGPEGSGRPVGQAPTQPHPEPGCPGPGMPVGGAVGLLLGPASQHGHSAAGTPRRPGTTGTLWVPMEVWEQRGPGAAPARLTSPSPCQAPSTSH